MRQLLQNPSLASQWKEQFVLVRVAKLLKGVEFEILWLTGSAGVTVVLLYYSKGTNLPCSLQLQVMKFDSISDNI